MIRSASNHRWIALLVSLALVVASCGDDNNTPAEPAGASDEGPTELTGLLRVEAGECGDAGVTSGSSFRMVQAGGSLEEGPFVPNGDSPCGDQTWTPLTPGTDGGLRLGEHQAAPEPAFDAEGNAVAGSVTKPATWFAVGFASATNPVDPQTGIEVQPPELQVGADGNVTGDLRAFAASWNGQHFNQGAPKPDGSSSGNTAGPTGTYDEATGQLVLEWSSQISGGAFDGFTGIWRLEGTLETN